MDTKELYRKYCREVNFAVWLGDNGELAYCSETVWHYCGVKEDFKKDSFRKECEKYFPDDEVYLIISSENSSLVPKSEISDRIAKFTGKKEIGIIDTSFKKILSLNSYGTFKKGVVIRYPKTRIKEEGTALGVEFRVHAYVSSPERVCHAVRDLFDKLGEAMSNDYGGDIEHLWISLELVEDHVTNGKSWPFRFQKRVPLSEFLPGEEYSYNVGSYSVAPDFEKLKTLPDELICDYVLNLVYRSTQVLINKQKKLGDFDAVRFRSDFVAVCDELGYSIKDK